MLKQDCLLSIWRLYTKTPNCMHKGLLQSKKQKVLLLQESMHLKLKRHSSAIPRIGLREALPWKGWNSSAANVGKKVIGASIAQQWEKFQAERISDADYVGERVIIAEHVESQSQRMSVNDNLGTAANVVKGGTTVVTVPDPPPLRLRLVLLAI